MLPNRKLIIGGGVFLTTVALLALFTEPNKTVNYWIGILFGGIVGILTVTYMMVNKIVDPEQAKYTFRERIESPWIIISVVGGLLLGRVVIQLLSTDLEVLFISFMLTWIILVFSYISLKVWKTSE